MKRLMRKFRPMFLRYRYAERRTDSCQHEQVSSHTNLYPERLLCFYSIEFKAVPVVLDFRSRLIRFSKNTIPNRKPLNFRSHKAAKRIFRRTDNGFTPDVEAGIRKNGATGLSKKLL